ncbi:MAG: translation initiation factor [Campylobacterales bacterium]|nr:translation initiation factor [Campylobacterales bacterium]
MFEMGAKLEEVALALQGKEEKKETKEATKPQKSHQLVFRFERRKGKPVTLVGRFALGEEDKKELLRFLKKKLACGGTWEEEWIALQGDVQTKVKAVLESEGWKFR